MRLVVIAEIGAACRDIVGRGCQAVHRNSGFAQILAVGSPAIAAITNVIAGVTGGDDRSLAFRYRLLPQAVIKAVTAGKVGLTLAEANGEGRDRAGEIADDEDCRK